MYPILILREELVCLVILLYLTVVSRMFKMGKDSRAFNRLLGFALLHVVLDGVTVWTVNHRDAIPGWVNDGAHMLFFLSALLFANTFFLYTMDLFYRGRLRKWYKWSFLPILIYAALLVTVLKTEYADFRGTSASVGSGPMAGYGLAFVYFIASIGVLLRNRMKLSRYFKASLMPMLIILIAAEIAQIFVPELLITGGAVTVITVAFFFCLENPSAVLERKAITDALSGLSARSSYEHDIVAYDNEFARDKTIQFIFLFVDINNLRSVNGLYGHQAGDEYISHIALMLTNHLKGAEHIYRMGGDDFLAIYRNQEEAVVIRDVRELRKACAEDKKVEGFTPELAMGYAVSNSQYNNLRDVMRVADYMMFRNKAELKREMTISLTHATGTQLNLMGLTDRVFDAMCISGEDYYPFLLNMETNVTRIPPAMCEFFGFEDEFIADFTEVWRALIHPDDEKEFMDDLTAVLTERKQYHYCRYRVRGKNGEYVEVSCRGGIYHGRDGEPDVFAGYMVNHGTPPVRDPATGLRNFYQMYDRLNELIREKTPCTVVRLEIKNINRIRMLYGSNVGKQLIRLLGETFQKTLGRRGEAYSNHGESFMMILNMTDEETIRDLYRAIQDRCVAGIDTGDYNIPVGLAAGAVRLPAEGLNSREDVRSAAMYTAEESYYSRHDAIRFFKADASEDSRKEMGLLRTIHRDCVGKREHFYLRYQPIIDLQSGRLTGAEALLRWRDREQGEVSPGRFISFLENDPGYNALGADVLRRAIRQARTIRENLPDFSINVNITALQLYAEDFIPMVLRMLKEEDFPAKHLILELTERCKEMDFEDLLGRVKELRSHGVRVALDDMGTGFSTIDLLLHLPVDEIKLDHAFTRELRDMSTNELYARVLCQAAQERGMMICFEGVETEEMQEYLKQFGHLAVQGYYYDKPLLPEEFERKYCGGE
ncbi:MAG: EAL domain-containing protein [Clostridia bacterium]|nr:EAL domain-containing protein [Clostridia bacterium]